MDLTWGAILIVFGLLCWVGQTMSAFSPTLATRLGFIEPESDVDPFFFVLERGLAINDTIMSWTLPVAGILLVLDSPSWAYFGLVGGGMYLYFSAMGIISRLALKRRGIRIGKPKSLITAYLSLTLWGLIAVTTIIMAVEDLPLP
jgi:hypothetical protein